VTGGRAAGGRVKNAVSLSFLLRRVNRTAVSVAIGIVFVATLAGSFVIGLMGLVESAHVQARVLADNAIPAIRFGDKRAARELLESLHHWPEVQAAELTGPDQRLLARYVRDGPAGPGTPAVADADPGMPMGWIHVRQDIEYGGGWFGRVTLTLSVAVLVRQTAWIGVVTLLAALAAFWVSGLLLRRANRSMLAPLRSLNLLMARVHGQSDFSVRARSSHVREIDALGQGFNEMIEKVQDRDRQLARLAFSDNLTGLPNRSAFLERLEREVQRAARRGHRLGLLFLDLDGFKQVNDTLGHDCGDRLLVEAAGRLREALRPSDATALAAGAANDSGAARLGGDEFTVLLPGLREVDDVLVVARRIGDLMRRPFAIGGRELSVTTSIGAAVFPDHGGDAATLLRNADAAMYHSKRAGRDNSRVYNAAMTEHATVRPQPAAEPRAARP